MIDTESIDDVFEEFCDEFLEFGRIENPKHRRPDICAFLMLDEIAPGNSGHERACDMISCARHGEFYLSTDVEEFCQNVTKDQIRDLVRCGLRYDPDSDCLCMFA